MSRKSKSQVAETVQAKARNVCPYLVDVVMVTKRFDGATGEPCGTGISRAQKVRCIHDADHGGMDGVGALHAGESKWGRVVWRSGETKVELTQERKYRGKKKPSAPPSAAVL